jgi:hypothetical protein
MIVLSQKVCADDCLTCKIQSSNDISEIKQSLNEKYHLIFV